MQGSTTPKRESRQYSVSLFPEQDQIIRTFCEEAHRNYSNAVQFIIEDWARQKQAALKAAEPEAVQ